MTSTSSQSSQDSPVKPRSIFKFNNCSVIITNYYYDPKEREEKEKEIKKDFNFFKILQKKIIKIQNYNIMK